MNMKRSQGGRQAVPRSSRTPAPSATRSASGFNTFRKPNPDQRILKTNPAVI